MADVIVRYGVNKLLQEQFGVSEPTVRKALNGITKSKLADQIRKVAIEEYGGRTDKIEKGSIHNYKKEKD